MTLRSQVERFISFAARRRVVFQAAADCLAWGIALFLATLIRYDLDVKRVGFGGLLFAVGIASGLHVLVGVLTGLYLGRWRVGSFDEVAALAGATALTTVALFGLDLFSVETRWVPLSAVLGGGFFAFVLMGGVRYAWRKALEGYRRPVAEAHKRMVVIGAGEGGVQAITALLRDPDSPYVPVALLDDDPAKRRLRVRGIPVMGDRTSLERVATQVEARVLLIAIPSAANDLVANLTERGFQAGLDVKVLPPVRDLFGSRVRAEDIRDVSEEDLLGRHVIETDVTSIAGYLTGKRVMVTGAGGSIGSELCRQIWRFAPAELVMLDRDESALHAIQLALEGRALLDTPNLVLQDIRDRDAVMAAFAKHRPQVVFHAAALKHLTLLERHPSEAVKSNVWGTEHVLEAAASAGVDRFVNVSTDKAADPVSVLGFTKRIAERLTAHKATAADGTYLSVRFGNVLGSRGSVLQVFRAQIQAGGPVTVTDPDVTRYFMTTPEAVELMMQAAAIGGDGEALVLDMGKPVRIADIAELLAARAPRPVKIEYTGLRRGEKLHEVLRSRDEQDHRPVHPLISHVGVPPLDPRDLSQLDLSAAPDRLVADLKAACGNGIPAAAR